MVFAFKVYSLASTNRQYTIIKKEEFNYLQIENDTLKSIHGLKYYLQKPEGFKLIKPINYQAVYNNHPFNVSVAAFINDNNIIAVHAEQVTDSSGFLDYSYLEPFSLNRNHFYMKSQCLEINREEIENAHDLRYFKENEFDFFPAIYLKQFFVNSPDGNSEYVITFGEKVSNCSQKTISDSLKKSIDNKIIEYLSTLKKTKQ
jgi:hypothetical protein